MAIISMIKKWIPRKLKNIIKRGLDCLSWDEWVNRSWSQEGEDMVLRRIFEKRINGFYVDVGAHHPKRFSNTYYFYRRGWSGINIDAMPGSMRLFKQWRPRDTNLEMGIALESGALDYYVFNEPALNGFSAGLSREREQANNPYHAKEIIKVNVAPLREVFDRYLGNNEIDFLSIDVEGLDLEVLRSNDWSKYRPKIVLAEILDSSLYDLDKDPVFRFMAEHGYAVFAKQVNTVFFKYLSADSLR